MRTDEELIGIIEAAFQPLECAAELSDYDSKLGFRVYYPDGDHITFRPTPVETLRSGLGLKAVIDATRSRIERKGLELAPWTLDG